MTPAQSSLSYPSAGILRKPVSKPCTRATEPTALAAGGSVSAHAPSPPDASAFGSKVLGLALVFFVLLSLVGADFANAQISAAQRAELTQVWQQEFPVRQAVTDPFRQQPQSQPLQSQSPVGRSDSDAFASSYPLHSHLRSDQPHPAVARIVVPEEGATSYGSGTLIDVRDEFGLVITNWHVVRDATGPIEVQFPGGFKTKARSLKVDSDWDLAALVIWRPPVSPVELSPVAPQQGDQLTICGYGTGLYRAATGRCTQYYAPRANFPQQMVELDVEARQGDSGGPIFDRRGQLAGVLFGAGQGTTLGSFGGRVESFLASLAPDIGRADEGVHLASLDSNPSKPQLDSPVVQEQQVVCRDGVCYPVESQGEELQVSDPRPPDAGFAPPAPQIAGMWPAAEDESDSLGAEDPAAGESVRGWHAVPRDNWFAQIKTALAAVGLMSVCMFLLKAVC